MKLQSKEEITFFLFCPMKHIDVNSYQTYMQWHRDVSPSITLCKTSCSFLCFHLRVKLSVIFLPQTPGALLTYFADGAGRVLRGFWGSGILAIRDFFGVFERCQNFFWL